VRPVRIIVGDAQYLTREGLAKLVSSRGDMELAGIADNASAFRELAIATQPDVMIFDHDHPEFLGPEIIPSLQLSAPESSIMVITLDRDPDHVFKLLEMGVTSILTKNCSSEEIINAIRAASKGEKFFCNAVLDKILEKKIRKTEQDCEPSLLTPREVEIVCLVAKGLAAREIADKLFLSTHTVYTHRKNIMKKLNINSAQEIMLYALNQGLVHLKEAN